MKVEIKEILSLLNSSSWSNEAKQIEDYITNLQKYYNDNVKKYEELLVKYSNLQEENKALKNQLDFIGEQNHIIDKLEKENEIVKSQLNICSQDLYMENLKLKLENKRLNNVINELEKWLKEQREFIQTIDMMPNLKEIKLEHKIMFNDYNNVLDKLKELKEGK